MGSTGVKQTDVLRPAATHTIPPDVTFPAGFHEHRARIDPDGLCWILGENRWSWGDAWDDIRRFAGALRRDGVGHGDRIAFLDSLNPAIVMAMHAACLIGAADVVLDPRLAPDEIAHILRDSGAKVLFVGHEHEPTIATLLDTLPPISVVLVGGAADELEPWMSGAEGIDRQSDVTPDDPCLVLYSSGTTGRQKGIMVTQHNVMTHVRCAWDGFELDDGDMILLTAMMFHPCAVLGAATGTPAIVVPTWSIELLTAALDAGLTHAFFTPPIIRRLHQAGPQVMSRFAALKAVTYGAAPMPTPLLRDALDAWPNTRFRQAYGMTETVAVLTALDDAAHRDADHPERLLSAGRPTPGVELRTVDPVTHRDVEPGDTGELWFRTEQTTPGFFNDPLATGELIIGDRWVRSGDIGRVDDDGFVFIVDRIKDLILHNADLVYPSEVERVLAEHPSVLESAVIGVPDEESGEAVKAVVVARPGSVVDATELMAFTGGKLALHKTPSSVDVVSTLPRNELGKILKRTLRDPYWAASERRI